MARTNQLLAAVETGLAEGRQIAAERAKLEQQARQDALAQSNVDRQFGLSVFNSMLQMQAQAPKPEDPMKAAAGTQLNQLIAADPDYFYGVLNNTYSDPVLLSQARQLGDMAGLKWIGDTIDTAGLRTEDRNRIAANNTLKRQLGVTPEIEDTIFQTLAAGGDMDAWVEAYNANLPEGARKMTATEGRLLGASTMQASGATVEFLAEQRFDKVMQDPKVQEFLAKADSALSRAADTTTRGGMGNEVDTLTFASREITRLGLDKTERGRALKKQYEDAATGIRSLNAAPPENRAENAAAARNARADAFNAGIADNVSETQRMVIESEGYTVEKVSAAGRIANGVATQADYDLFGRIDPETKKLIPAPRSEIGADVGQILRLANESRSRAGAVTQSISMGYDRHPASTEQIGVENTALTKLKEKLVSAKADSYADAQPLEVAVYVQEGRALAVSKATRDANIFKFATRKRDSKTKLTEAGLAAVLVAAEDTADPVKVKAYATADYMINSERKDVDETWPGLVSQFGMSEEDAKKVAAEVGKRYGKE